MAQGRPRATRASGRGGSPSRRAETPAPAEDGQSEARRPERAGVAKRTARATPAGAVGAAAVGTTALGSLAIGALAFGALAIGALAIGRLAVGRARIRRLEIDELIVHRETRP